jgi:5-methylcytosine-specific restriction endonuclease McrA
VAKTPLQIPKRVRQAVYDRDEGVCQMCGRPTQNIHHIIGGGMGRRRCHHIANLITLCDFPYDPNCHDQTHRGKRSEELQQWCENWSRERYGDVIDQIKQEGVKYAGLITASN